MYPQVSSITIGIDPTAFTIGSVEVKWWSIIFIIAVLVILLWLWRFGRGFGIKPEFVVGIVAVAVPVGLVVSRLVHVVDDLDYYTSHPASIIGLEGLTIFGGILGAALGHGYTAGCEGCLLPRLLTWQFPVLSWLKQWEG